MDAEADARAGRRLFFGISVAVVAASALAASRAVSGAERAVFEVLNGMPDVVAAPFVALQILGAIELVGFVALVVGAIWTWRAGVAAAIAALGARGAAEVLKALVDRPRPAGVWPPGAGGHRRGMTLELRVHDPGGAGFPSGHAAVVFAIAAVVATLVPRPWRWAPFAVAAVAALGRVVGGVHLPLDVVGGGALGLLAGALAAPMASREGHAPASSHHR